MNVSIWPKKRKRGDLREDGYVFYSYQKRNGKLREIWMTPDAISRANESNKRWKNKNPDRHRVHSRASVAKWRSSHPEQYADSRRKYFSNNSEKIRERGRAKRAKIKEAGGTAYQELLAYYRRLNRQWVLANPEKHTARAIRRRARHAASIVPMTSDERSLMRAIYTMCRRVTQCTGITHHVDHIIPLFHGGAHYPTNLQVLPAVINLRKGTKAPTSI